MLYLDYAATTPLNKEVFDTYKELLIEYFGNPDSIHNIGFEAHRLVESSRENILKLLKLNKYQLIFCSGASEANNLALKGYALANQHKGKHIITTCVEHASVLNACRQLERLHGFNVTYLEVDKKGCVSVESVKEALTSQTILASVMAVNNEIGAINPFNEIGLLLKDKRIPLHVDLVQAIGKIELNLENVSMGTFSAHKMNGLKGSGALFIKDNLKLEPLICGGAQEYGLRGGTNNAPVNIILAKTLRIALENQAKAYASVLALKNYILNELRDVASFNCFDDSSPFIISMSTVVGSEIMMNALQKEGFLVSARSTCASKYKSASHVLLAIKLSEDVANKTIRISLHKDVNVVDIEQFCISVRKIIASNANRR